jgi:hypothetical protein
MDRTRRTGAFLAIPAAIAVLLGCAAIAPPKVQVRSLLVPVPEELGEGYSLEEDGTMIYQRPGMKVSVRAISDDELNAMYPQQSHNGKASTNPYTYGDWVDPELGYTPSRFTVFTVTVHNYTMPKINLDPAQARLITDRGGQLLAYLTEAGEGLEDHLNFEDYYRSRMGHTGVEENRFAERMGLVRQTLYVDGRAFKGDVKEGFLAFDALDPRVKKARLELRNFVLAYDANDWPAETVDLVFPYTRQIEETTAKKAQ